jgi:ketosteroid isomerase-like protein
MRLTWQRSVLTVVLLACGAAVSSAQGVKSDQQMLMDLERQWDDAFRTNNVRFIDSILDPDFLATYDNGTRADRKKELELAASNNQQIDDSDLDDFTIKIYGNTAIVWFTLRLLGPIQGKPVVLTYHYTDVWVLRDGGNWRCVASQSTRVPPTPDTPAN